jgi:probable phosphoglycerate mutase
MIRLALVRHAPTTYNHQGRMQGARDVPLSAEGRKSAASWAVPTELAGFIWQTSPLARTRDTARLMGIQNPTVEPRLIEMDWGRWEGRLIDELRAELGAEMADNEAGGLDFRPDGGESPREVQARLAPWLDEIAGAGHDTGAVTHKGVIRALFAQAMDWDMTGRPPARLDWTAAHVFIVDGHGRPTVERLNVSLAAP